MTLEEMRTVVAISVAMRIPRFAQGQRPTNKIERLEDYLLACAHMRGDLEEARIWASRLLCRIEDEWDDEDDATLAKTAYARNQAKRAVRPDLYGALQDARQLKQDIDRQIGRLTHDESTSSRAYTFITGSA